MPRAERKMLEAGQRLSGGAAKLLGALVADDRAGGLEALERLTREVRGLDTRRGQSEILAPALARHLRHLADDGLERLVSAAPNIGDWAGHASFDPAQAQVLAQVARLGREILVARQVHVDRCIAAGADFDQLVDAVKARTGDGVSNKTAFALDLVAHAIGRVSPAAANAFIAQLSDEDLAALLGARSGTGVPTDGDRALATAPLQAARDARAGASRHELDSACEALGKNSRRVDRSDAFDRTDVFDRLTELASAVDRQRVLDRCFERAGCPSTAADPSASVRDAIGPFKIFLGDSASASSLHALAKLADQELGIIRNAATELAPFGLVVDKQALHADVARRSAATRAATGQAFAEFAPALEQTPDDADTLPALSRAALHFHTHLQKLDALGADVGSDTKARLVSDWSGSAHVALARSSEDVRASWMAFSEATLESSTSRRRRPPGRTTRWRRSSAT